MIVEIYYNNSDFLPFLSICISGGITLSGKMSYGHNNIGVDNIVL